MLRIPLACLLVTTSVVSASAGELALSGAGRPRNALTATADEHLGGDRHCGAFLLRSVRPHPHGFAPVGLPGAP